MIKPYLFDRDVTLYHGDALCVLRQLPDRSVHACMTSPPFYGLRSYGHWELVTLMSGPESDEGSWDHFVPPKKHSERWAFRLRWRAAERGGIMSPNRRTWLGHLGLEPDPDLWVKHLVEIFREVRRVLRDDGTLWIEVGDAYAGSWGAQGHRETPATISRNQITNHPKRASRTGAIRSAGLKAKDLHGLPWLLAFALRADGWYLRSEIIWHKQNPMPESVTDRPTKAHSTIFLLSKSPRYFFDADAIREPYAGLPDVRQGRVGAYQNRAMNGVGDGTTPARVLAVPPPQVETLDDSDGEAPRGPDGRRITTVKAGENSEQHRDGERWPNPAGANARSVWTVPTEPTSFQHFASWPQALVRRMILAGTSECGCCPECGAPWMRLVEVESSWRPRAENGATRGNLARQGFVGAGTQRAVHGKGVSHDLGSRQRNVVGWRPSCDCLVSDGTPERQYRTQVLPDPVPAVVLDPFAGSGTTLLVARKLGRHAVGVELNADYCEIAAQRLAQQSLFADTR